MVVQRYRASVLLLCSAFVQPLQQAGADDKLFEIQITGILSKHCLECHDTLTKKGQLDLSRKATFMAGGEHGPVYIAGKTGESRIWQRVESNEMPKGRTPLSPEEKKVLRQWLDDGAGWSLDVIDPAIYSQSRNTSAVFVQRLTVPEYIESVRSTLGVEISKEARKLLPRDVRADGFSNTAYNLGVDLPHIEAYAALAETIVGRVDFKALASRHTNSRELTDENLAKIITPVGLQLFRGPVSKEELALYCGVSTSVAGSGGNFEEAIGCILEAMLQSPRFLYRVEDQRGNGSPRQTNSYEMASRLSYIVWGAPPDDELLKVAEKNGFDRAGVEKQVRRMLQDRRAIDQSRRFIVEWLDLDRLSGLRPDPKKFPGWDARLAADMRNETLSFFEEVVWKQKRPLADLLNARVTFVTPRLAKHYGLAIDDKKDDKKDDEIVRLELAAETGRGGLLTQGSVLTVGGDDASMVSRGLFVMHELLRGIVRDPPPGVDTTKVHAKAGLTNRAIAESRINNNNCSACHNRFEPLAFGLEKFDGLGIRHETDEFGNKLRDDGVVFFPTEGQPVAYRSSAELMDLLAKSDRVRESLTWKITQFAIGRPLGAADAPQMIKIHKASQDAGGTYANLMTAIVLSDLVQTVRTEPASKN